MLQFIAFLPFPIADQSCHLLLPETMMQTLVFISLALVASSTNAFVAKPLSKRLSITTNLHMSATPFDEYEMNSSSSVVYKDTLLGTGDEVKKGDIVTVGYKGTVMQTQKPFGEGTFKFQFGEDKVMPGWNDAVDGMRVGGARTALIPPSKAYGSTGQATIPPNSDLQMEIELQAIKNGVGAWLEMEFGLGNNLKTYGMAFFAAVLAFSSFLPS